MPKHTMTLGIALIVLGVAGFALAGGGAMTALIPAGFGLIFLTLGAVSKDDGQTRKHAMHAAAALALLGFLGTAPALRFGLYLFSVGPTHVDRPAAVVMQSLMAVGCGIYLYMSIRSFVDARRNRSAGAGTDSRAG